MYIFTYVHIHITRVCAYCMERYGKHGSKFIGWLGGKVCKIITPCKGHRWCLDWWASSNSSFLMDQDSARFGGARIPILQLYTPSRWYVGSWRIRCVLRPNSEKNMSIRGELLQAMMKDHRLVESAKPGNSELGEVTGAGKSEIMEFWICNLPGNSR